MSEKVDRKDIQGLLASGYNHLNYARFLFLRVIDRVKARAWLAKVVDKVTTAEYPGKHKPANCLNLAADLQGNRGDGNRRRSDLRLLARIRGRDDSAGSCANTW